MRQLIGILGALQILGGVLVYYVAKSAIHELLAAVAFGMGVLAVGLELIVERLDRQRAIFEALVNRNR